jgi:hypothetical protein
MILSRRWQTEFFSTWISHPSRTNAKVLQTGEEVIGAKVVRKKSKPKCEREKRTWRLEVDQKPSQRCHRAEGRADVIEDTMSSLQCLDEGNGHEAGWIRRREAWETRARNSEGTIVQCLVQVKAYTRYSLYCKLLSPSCNIWGKKTKSISPLFLTSHRFPKDYYTLRTNKNISEKGT